jgi:hypothetical protein
MNYVYVDDLDKLAQNNNRVIMVPVLSDLKRHYNNNRISFIYVYDINTHTEYIINSKHADFKPTKNLNLINSKFTGEKFVYRRRYASFLKTSYDIDILLWMDTVLPLEVKFNDEVNTYHNWYNNLLNINDNIPMMLWLIYCRNITEQTREYIKTHTISLADMFYNRMLDNFMEIEKTGLAIDTVLAKKFDKTLENTVYGYYNICTTTGRPSNTFNGFNYAAINKHTGIRSIIVPKDDGDVLVEFDYDSMHIRLVANMINFNLPSTNLHEYFSSLYFKEAQTNETYEKSKVRTWQLLYGNITGSDLKIPFFKAIHLYKQALFEKFNTVGYIELPISKRKMYSGNYTPINANLLFNYMLQGYESEFNAIILYKIRQYLYEKKSKIILYTYDSFLFNIDKNERHIVKELKNIIEIDNFTAKCKAGWNYGEMKKVNI